MGKNKRFKRKSNSKLGSIDKKQRKHLLDFGEQHPIDDKDINDQISDKFVKRVNLNETQESIKKPLIPSIEDSEEESDSEEEDDFSQLLNCFGNKLNEQKSRPDSDSEEYLSEDNDQNIETTKTESTEQSSADKTLNDLNIEDIDENEVEEEEDTEDLAEKDNICSNDPFSTHFDRELDALDVDYLNKSPKKTFKEHEWKQMKKFIEINNEKQKYISNPMVLKQNINQFFLKNIINENLSKAVITSDSSQSTVGLNAFQYELLSIISEYKDLLFTERNFKNAENIRLIYTIHALNHILKTRSRILNHNYKIRQHVSSNEEYRDQGLSRPKVLILVPFRDSVLKIVRILISLMFGDIKDKSEKKANIMSGKRFFEEFSPEQEIPKLHKKPEDYELTFAGNIDDSFRIGISVTKKSLKLYSDFYSSDILIASPLGLRMIIGSEGDSDREYDFLSSIEVVIMDQMEVFLMQNWEHMITIMKFIHLTPTQSRDIEFSRVRMWTLEGWQKFYCQLMVFSSITVPSITAFFNKHSANYLGKVLTKNEINSSKAAVNSVYIQVPQVFHRFECSSLASSSDQRFEFFISKILPKFRDKLMGRTMIYIQSYFDFVRIRNHFRKEEINFTQICEYTKDGKVAKARSMFFNGGRHFMLYTERFHYYHRYRIKGIRNLIFYEMPYFQHFYNEMINFMHISMQGKKFVGDYGSMSCTVLYNRFDALQLSAIVGHSKAAQMLRSNTSVHMFVTENK